MRKWMVFLAASVVALSTLWADASADKRWYVWTYQYATVPRGEAEFESYFTISTPDRGSFEGKAVVEHQFELEVGMTDRFDFSVYQVFQQGPGDGESLRYKGFKLRSRYRFGEAGAYPVDPLLYLEYKGVADFSEHAIETKLILAKDVGKVNISLNPILELEKEGDEWKAEAEYAVGACLALGELNRIGLESKGSEYGHYLGPVFSHGTERLWATLGTAVGIADISDGRPEFEVRLLLGAGL